MAAGHDSAATHADAKAMQTERLADKTELECKWQDSLALHNKGIHALQADLLTASNSKPSWRSLCTHWTPCTKKETT